MRKNHGKNVIIPLYWPVGQEGNFSKVVNVLFDTDIPAEIADDVAECKSLWMDAIAETDEDLMERFLEGEELTEEEIILGLKGGVANAKVVPVLCGSATKNIACDKLLDLLVDYGASPLAHIDAAAASAAPECAV